MSAPDRPDPRIDLERAWAQLEAFGAVVRRVDIHTLSPGEIGFLALHDVVPMRQSERRISRNGSPTCPYCGDHETSRVDHPGGTYFCPCGCLFNGSDAEFRRLAKHRQDVAARRWDAGAAS